MNNKLFRQR